MNDSFLFEAIRLSVESIADGGGPFGAVVACGGEIVGRGANRVTLSNDPTAHAEITAIRDACRARKSFTLADCELYSSCEPCPMCLSAAYWARIERVYYAGTRDDAAVGGFDDVAIYEEFAIPPEQRRIPTVQTADNELLDAARKAFVEWAATDDRTPY